MPHGRHIVRKMSFEELFDNPPPPVPPTSEPWPRQRRVNVQQPSATPYPRSVLFTSNRRPTLPEFLHPNFRACLQIQNSSIAGSGKEEKSTTKRIVSAQASEVVSSDSPLDLPSSPTFECREKVGNQTGEPRVRKIVKGGSLVTIPILSPKQRPKYSSVGSSKEVKATSDKDTESSLKDCELMVASLDNSTGKVQGKGSLSKPVVEDSSVQGLVVNEENLHVPMDVPKSSSETKGIESTNEPENVDSMGKSSSKIPKFGADTDSQMTASCQYLYNDSYNLNKHVDVHDSVTRGHVNSSSSTVRANATKNSFENLAFTRYSIGQSGCALRKSAGFIKEQYKIGSKKDSKDSSGDVVNNRKASHLPHGALYAALTAVKPGQLMRKAVPKDAMKPHSPLEYRSMYFTPKTPNPVKEWSSTGRNITKEMLSNQNNRARRNDKETPESLKGVIEQKGSYSSAELHNVEKTASPAKSGNGIEVGAPKEGIHFSEQVAVCTVRADYTKSTAHVLQSTKTSVTELTMSCTEQHETEENNVKSGKKIEEKQERSVIKLQDVQYNEIETAKYEWKQESGDPDLTTLETKTANESKSGEESEQTVTDLSKNLDKEAFVEAESKRAARISDDRLLDTNNDSVQDHSLERFDPRANSKKPDSEDEIEELVFEDSGSECGIDSDSAGSGQDDSSIDTDNSDEAIESVEGLQNVVEDSQQISNDSKEVRSKSEKVDIEEEDSELEEGEIISDSSLESESSDEDIPLQQVNQDAELPKPLPRGGDEDIPVQQVNQNAEVPKPLPRDDEKINVALKTDAGENKTGIKKTEEEENSKEMAHSPFTDTEAATTSATTAATVTTTATPVATTAAASATYTATAATTSIAQQSDEAFDEIDDLARQAVLYCKTHGIENPVEILRYYQKIMVYGRAIQIQDESQLDERTTNFILVDRNNLVHTAFDEIKSLKELRKTLEVQFYGEEAEDYGGPRKEFFCLILREIYVKYFEKGLKEHIAEDYNTVGIVLGLSILQDGKLPQFLDENVLQEIFAVNVGNQTEPTSCIDNLRLGFQNVGIYQIASQMPIFLHLLRPGSMQSLTVKSICNILKPQLSEEGSNSRKQENAVYAVFLKYLREVAKKDSVGLQTQQTNISQATHSSSTVQTPQVNKPKQKQSLLEGVCVAKMSRGQKKKANKKANKKALFLKWKLKKAETKQRKQQQRAQQTALAQRTGKRTNQGQGGRQVEAVVWVPPSPLISRCPEPLNTSLLASVTDCVVDVTVAASEKELVKKKTRGGDISRKKKKYRQKRWNERIARVAERDSQVKREVLPPAVCTFYLEGRCRRGDECQFRHEGTPVKLRKLCRYYKGGICSNGDDCRYLHSSFPCKFFNTSSCQNGDHCRFSHDDLTADTKELLEQFLTDEKANASGLNTAKSETPTASSTSNTTTSPYILRDVTRKREASSVECADDAGEAKTAKMSQTDEDNSITSSQTPVFVPGMYKEVLN